LRALTREWLHLSRVSTIGLGVLAGVVFWSFDPGCDPSRPDSFDDEEAKFEPAFTWMCRAVSEGGWTIGTDALVVLIAPQGTERQRSRSCVQDRGSVAALNVLDTNAANKVAGCLSGAAAA
jgi:hypothetical protein